MSRRMVETFFPGVRMLVVVEPVWRQPYEWLFPAKIALQCPEVVIHVLSWPVLRSPVLGAVATVGIGIGLGGAWRLRQCDGEGEPFYWRWSNSFVWFGMMNVSAVLMHCLQAAPPTDYPTDSPWLWWTDCYCTGASAWILWAESTKQLTQGRYSKTFVSICHQVGHVVGILTVVWFVFGHGLLLQDGDFVSRTLPLELWYLTPPAMAGPPLVAAMCLSGRNHNSNNNAAIAIVMLGAVIGFVGILLDAWFCRALDSVAWDLLQATTLVFMGCDMVFFGIAVWLLQERVLLLQEKKKK